MATWAATTFCTAADVRTRAPEIDASFNQGKAVIGTAEINKKITLAKDQMRQDVLVRVAESYATKVQDWLAQAQSIVDRRRESSAAEYDRAGYDPLGDGGDAFTSASTFASGTRRLMPQTFTHEGTPTNGTSGTQATFAENGARLVDTKYSFLYINRGTLASPTWEKLTPESAIDYITNPTELKHAAVMLTLTLLYEDRVHRFTANHDANFDRLASIVAYCRDQYTKHFDIAYRLLGFDLSNDGTVDEFERSSTRRTTYIA